MRRGRRRLRIRDTSTIDSLLEDGVRRGDVRGVVAIAATRHETVYRGAFGRPFRDADENMRLDSVFRIASMTKAITCVAAMQLIEQGLVDLDAPVSEYIPSFSDLQVLEGLDETSRQARLRPPATPVTVRQLLSHTAGFGYEIWNPLLHQAVASGAAPSIFASGGEYLQAPLLFDPGSQWQYGISTDWLGRLVEIVRGISLDRALMDEILTPLGMNDTHFNLPTDKVSRLVAQHARLGDGSLAEAPRETPPSVSFFRGGDGLYSTAVDYARFLQALLNGGEGDGTRILKEESVALMGRNQIGDLQAGALSTCDPRLSNSFDLLPDSEAAFGLGFLINQDPVTGGRASGSLAWAGLLNTFFWIDPASNICGVLMTQILPFYDAKVVALFDAFEREIYQELEIRD
jgi:methyl acetate hydrolase